MGLKSHLHASSVAAMTLPLPQEHAQGTELRRHPRAAFERRVWCEHGRLTLYLSISNLSLGGMFIHTSTPFRPGGQLRVSVLERPAIVTDVEVVWACRRGQMTGIGCRVVAFAQGAEHYLQLVRQLSAASR